MTKKLVKESNNTLVSAALAGDALGFQEIFNQAMATRIRDQIEEMTPSVAQSLFGGIEESEWSEKAAKARYMSPEYHENMHKHYSEQAKRKDVTDSYRSKAANLAAEHKKKMKSSPFSESYDVAEGLEGPYQHAYHEAKKVLHPQHHAAAAKAFASMESGDDEDSALKRHGLHKIKELKPVLNKYKIGSGD